MSRAGDDRLGGRASAERRAFGQLSLLDDGSPAESGGLAIRSSRRAKRLTLRVVPPYRVELVVPTGTRPRAIEAFLRDSRQWIHRAYEELEARYPAERRRLPTRVELAAIGKRWRVDVGVDPHAPPRLGADRERLALQVPSAHGPEGFELLRRWLLRQGREHLTPWLAAEAQRVGLEPRGVQIRTQRTRWGSCSQTGNISLNAALLLLPPPLVRYLLVHELCHLRYLDHSARYWRLVKRHDPDFGAHDTALSAAWAEIPAWALPRR